jgi:uncharacterized OsmC-like protein
MAAQSIAAALQRTESVLRRRPSAGLHDDAPGMARWTGGMRIVASHSNGHQILTDMPTELGGSGDQVSPGWLMRAGLASCTATCIAMAAVSGGIELDALEVRASSRSDTRGLLSMADADGTPVYPGPHDMQMLVRISAHGVSPERLRALVEDSQRSSPVLSALQDAVPVALRIEVDGA